MLYNLCEIFCNKQQWFLIQGDSGGGLMCWEPDNRWTLVGVLSKGRYNCAANSPNVFTKIGSMRQWIEESMGWTSEDLG